MRHADPLPPVEPLVASPKLACHMLNIGMTRLYALLDGGALESFLDGTSRKITVKSIKAYVEHKLEASAARRLEDA